LSANHRLGAAGGRYHYGLFSERRTGAHEDGYGSRGELVAVASFAGPRRWNKEGGIVASYEWVRYASLKGCRVVGGMGKLLAAFVEEKRPDDVMSYADPDSVDGGSVYRRLGFKSEGIVEVADAFSAGTKRRQEKFRKNYPV